MPSPLSSTRESRARWRVGARSPRTCPDADLTSPALPHVRPDAEPPHTCGFLRSALPEDEYEEALAKMTHEKMCALAAKGRQVPVDEPILQEQLEEILSASELSTLRVAEREAMHNAARAAMRMEKLLEKMVPLSDELVIACQRGETWASQALDKLVRANLSPDEIAALHAMEELILRMIFEEGVGELGELGDDAFGESSGGGGGGDAVRVRGAAIGGGDGRDGTMIDRRRADFEYQSLLIDLQVRHCLR